VIQVRKGDTIGEFLRAIQQQLAPEFREIRTTSVENLLYVKEDLIIPHVRRPDLFLVSANLCTSLCLCGRVPISLFDSFISVTYLFPCILQQHSFYDLIVNKARGKSGPVCFFYLEFVMFILFPKLCIQNFLKTVHSHVLYSF